jgi:hypothetical protein
MYHIPSLIPQHAHNSLQWSKKVELQRPNAEVLFGDLCVAARHLRLPLIPAWLPCAVLQGGACDGHHCAAPVIPVTPGGSATQVSAGLAGWLAKLVGAI